MNTFLTSRQRGFAIADALIAFGVMVFAGIALLSLQGDLMNGSRSSKAQAEAMVIARDHMEMWRNYVAEDQYLAGPSPSKPISPNKIKGVNAEFMVRYLNQPAPADEAKLLTVSVCWECDVDADGILIKETEKSVSLETMLYYTKPEIASAITDQNDGVSDPSDFQLPSPWITGVEGPHESTESLKPEDDTDGWMTPVDLPPHMVMRIDESGGISFSEEIVTIKTYTNPGPGPGTGRTNVEVLFDGDVQLTSFGGIVHQITGEIILHPGSQTTVTDISRSLRLLASPPSFCVFPICDDADETSTELLCEKPNGAKFISYFCFVPGDCTYGDPDAVGCPRSLSENDVMRRNPTPHGDQILVNATRGILAITNI